MLAYCLMFAIFKGGATRRSTPVMKVTSSKRRKCIVSPIRWDRWRPMPKIRKVSRLNRRVEMMHQRKPHFRIVMMRLIDIVIDMVNICTRFMNVWNRANRRSALQTNVVIHWRSRKTNIIMELIHRLALIITTVMVRKDSLAQMWKHQSLRWKTTE